jgi:hypothetical protein
MNNQLNVKMATTVAEVSGVGTWGEACTLVHLPSNNCALSPASSPTAVRTVTKVRVVYKLYKYINYIYIIILYDNINYIHDIHIQCAARVYDH